MKLSDHKRRSLIVAALVATLLAVYFAPPAEEPMPASDEESSSVMTTADEVKAGGQLAKADSNSWRPQKRTALAGEPGDLFQVDRPPPPPPAKIGRPAPPPAPVAPPLPYSYMGRMADEGVLTVFLLRQGQEKPYLAKVGDVLDGQYRVEAIRPPLVEFTYIPLGQKQTLNIGSNEQAEAATAPPRLARPAPPDMNDIQQRLKQMLNSGATP